jgi:hypothetical protein
MINIEIKLHLATLMVASENCDSISISDFQSYEKLFDTVKIEKSKLV